MPRFKYPLSTRTAFKWLPLWDRVVFVDWYGVLSKDQFWGGILGNKKHRFNRRLAEAVRKLFDESSGMTERWMKGYIDSRQVIDYLDLPIHGKHSQQYWHRALLKSCKNMRCNSLITCELTSLAREGVFLVLATDNMDCFFQTVDGIENLDALFDCVLCSSRLGVLKGEDPERFFGDWLRVNGFQPNQALLLDDSEANCHAFEKMGGTAKLVNNPEDAVLILRELRKKIASSRK